MSGQEKSSVSVLGGIGEVAASDWDRVAIAARSARQSICLPCLPQSARRCRRCLRSHGMGAAASGSRRGRHRHRSHALLPEVPQPRRVHLRLRLGRRLRAGRRPILSQAPGRGAFHACARPPPSCPDRRWRGRTRAHADRRCNRACTASRSVITAHHVCIGRRVDQAWPTGASATHGSAVPLAECGLRQLRGFSRDPRLAQAQGGAQGA